MARKPKKLDPTSIRLEPATKEALELLAQEWDRPLAWVVNLALREWLESRGKHK
jgi:predicted transcriptional regulator